MTKAPKAAPTKRKPPQKTKITPTLTKADQAKEQKAAKLSDEERLATEQPRLKTLRATDTPGVFRNRANVLVDRDGIALTIKQLKALNDAAETDVLGKKADTPAEYLKSVALDPRAPRAVRLDAAKASAQYYTPKLNAIQGVQGGAPIQMEVDLTKLSQAQLDQYEKLLTQMAELQEKAR